MSKPPLMLFLPAYVVEYALVPDSITHVPGKKIWAGNHWLGPVPRLAISKNFLTDEYHLSHCDVEWQELSSIESGDTIEKIKIVADRHYPGINEYWMETGYKETDAVRAHSEALQDNACSFCGKSALDSEAAIASMICGRNDARICDICIRQLRDDLDSEDT